MATVTPNPPEKPYMPTEDERMWGLIAHLSPLAGGMVGLPFLGPLVVWLIKKDQSPFVGDQAKEALNFQIAVLIAVLVLFVTCIGAILAPVVAIAGLVFSIIGAIEANKGVYYRYPYTLRLIN
jgi:uncharacterized Tic20 family protein